MEFLRHIISAAFYSKLYRKKRRFAMYRFWTISRFYVFTFFLGFSSVLLTIYNRIYNTEQKLNIIYSCYLTCGLKLTKSCHLDPESFSKLFHKFWPRIWPALLLHYIQMPSTIPWTSKLIKIWPTSIFDV